jgi:S-formylglutathione hydrolase
VPWGIKAFGNYLGEDRARWADHDACELVKRRTFPGTILVDQGTADQFLARELQPKLFETACREAGQPLDLQLRDGYDHSYWFVQTFVERHLRHHASVLRA